MTDFRRVTDDLSVSPQIAVGDIHEAAGLGFRTIINNRPDGEAPDQPPGPEIAAAAAAAGLTYVHIPIVGMPNEAQVEQVRDAVQASTGPVLMFCRSGTRSIITWAVGQAIHGDRSRPELVALGGAAGYDLTQILPYG